MKLVEKIAEDLSAIREKRPLVHSITNYVVMNETANATLCIGALPIMSHAKEEVEEMAGIAGALVLNIGTLSPDWIDAMELAGKRASEKNIPVILDPVGAGATKLRIDSSKRLLEKVRVSIVRGNAAELAALAGITSEVRGVESMGASETPVNIAKRFASAYGCTAAITGAVDVVSDGSRTAQISNGHVMMSKVVGTGCMSDVIVAAFASVETDTFTAAVGGLAAFGIAGELAASASGNRPGTFHLEMYNALYALTPEDILNRSRIEVPNQVRHDGKTSLPSG
ncbi:MAG TPA: hydroxyethylthiazole kinase [Armatimonadota bacterium]|nr:hydroxyethylthiazole kinase [Armatimonadota bacterium]